MVLKFINRQLNAGTYHVSTLNIHTDNLTPSKLMAVLTDRVAPSVV